MMSIPFLVLSLPLVLLLLLDGDMFARCVGGCMVYGRAAGFRLWFLVVLLRLKCGSFLFFGVQCMVPGGSFMWFFLVIWGSVNGSSWFFGG